MERKHIQVVAGLISRDDKILVCQRRRDSAFPLKWEFPGGKIESGETAVEALRRELREELGIEIAEASLVSRHEHDYPEGLRVSLHFHRVGHFSGEVKNLVFERILWSPLDELVKLDFLEGDRPMIRRLAGGGCQSTI